MSALLPTMIGLGMLVDFIIRDAQGRRLRVTPTGERWLAWNADTCDLVVLRPSRGAGSVPNPLDAKRHRAFHGAEPQCARPMEWPKTAGKPRVLGLLEAVTYDASGIRSPSKGPHHWIHQFGDRGEHGHGSAHEGQLHPYAQRLMPRLDADVNGNLIVVRLPGNLFTVRDWIIG